MACAAEVLCNALIPRRQALSVYYGGARKGDIGGPLVKVQRLQEHFPEVRWGYNVVYLLSNAPYLPQFALTCLKRRGIPMVHNQNGVFYKAWFGGDWEARNRQMAQQYHIADWVFYQSEFCRRAADRFLGLRHGPGEILYNAVDTARFTPGIEQQGRRRQFTFLLTGKISNHLFYRVESTIAGLSKARQNGLDARLVVAGWVENDAKSHAIDLAAKLDVLEQVNFTGAYTQEEAPQLYRNSDAYVMTKHNDPCPNTVLEALSCGLPVLYSATGGVAELVGCDAGIGLPVKEDWETQHSPSADAISEGMIKIAANHNAYSEAARARAVERFDLKYWIDRHRAVFERLVGPSA